MIMLPLKAPYKLLKLQKKFMKFRMILKILVNTMILNKKLHLLVQVLEKVLATKSLNNLFIIYFVLLLLFIFLFIKFLNTLKLCKYFRILSYNFNLSFYFCLMFYYI